MGKIESNSRIRNQKFITLVYDILN